MDNKVTRLLDEIATELDKALSYHIDQPITPEQFEEILDDARQLMENELPCAEIVVLPDPLKKDRFDVYVKPLLPVGSVDLAYQAISAES